MSNITFHDFLEHQVPNVYEKVPHSGFQSNDEKGQPITVEQYFDIIFTEIEEKLATSVSAVDKSNLDLSKLIQHGESVKQTNKNFSEQAPSLVKENLITDAKSTKNDTNSDEKLKAEKYDQIQTLIEKHVKYIKSL